jgi:hypothetical protein
MDFKCGPPFTTSSEEAMMGSRVERERMKGLKFN